MKKPYFLILLIVLFSTFSWSAETSSHSSGCSNNLISSAIPFDFQLFSTGRNFFDMPEYYEALEKNPKLAKNLISAWYRDKVVNLLAPLEEKHFGLLTDPGILTRYDEFLTFINAYFVYLKNHSSASSFMVREAFKAHLGKEKVYRTMFLNDNELADVLKAGIFSTQFIKFQKNKQDYKDFLREILIHKEREDGDHRFFPGPWLEMRARLSGLPSMAISTSKYPEIAAGIAFYHKPNQEFKNEGKKFYLFELDVWTIDTIRPVGLFEVAQPGRNSDSSWRVGNLEISHSPEIEISIMNHVLPGQISSVRELDGAQRVYH